MVAREPPVEVALDVFLYIPADGGGGLDEFQGIVSDVIGEHGALTGGGLGGDGGNVDFEISDEAKAAELLPLLARALRSAGLPNGAYFHFPHEAMTRGVESYG